MNLLNWISRHIHWSRKTFGTSNKTEGVINHIEKEVDELRRTVFDYNTSSLAINSGKHSAKEKIVLINENNIFKSEALMECVDLIILSVELAWRLGFNANEIEEALAKKQYQNINERKWPKVGTVPDNQPTEHIKENI